MSLFIDPQVNEHGAHDNETIITGPDKAGWIKIPAELQEKAESLLPFIIVVETAEDGVVDVQDDVVARAAYIPPAPPVLPPTNNELAAENKLLKAQLAAVSDRNDFMEECIAEMATLVYTV